MHSVACGAMARCLRVAAKHSPTIFFFYHSFCGGLDKVVLRHNQQLIGNRFQAECGLIASPIQSSLVQVVRQNVVQGRTLTCPAPLFYCKWLGNGGEFNRFIDHPSSSMPVCIGVSVPTSAAVSFCITWFQLILTTCQICYHICGIIVELDSSEP